MTEEIKKGRPSTFTQEIANTICDRLTGGESLRQICRDDNMPAASQVCLWLTKNTVFREQYSAAREAQVEAFYDDLNEIADDGTNDWMERETKRGNTIVVPNHEHISRSKLRAEVRMWALSKMQPKKYGNKNFQEITGKDGNPLNPTMSDAQIAAALTAMATNAPLPNIGDKPEAPAQDDLADLV